MVSYSLDIIAEPVASKKGGCLAWLWLDEMVLRQNLGGTIAIADCW